MSPTAVLGFAAVSVAIIVVPGPSVLFAVGRAIAVGQRRALLTVLGNAMGLFLQVVVVALGLGVIVTASAGVYALVKLLGAAYLVWLGLSAIRNRAEASSPFDPEANKDPSRPLLDGLVVGASNPKSLVFLAALLPQSVDPTAGAVAAQMMLLGAVFCTIALVCDGAWALAAARARSWFATDPSRLAGLSLAGGLVMVGLGLLLAAS
jgi:threonine/homoserine/homoserine lactone efflux protein